MRGKGVSLRAFACGTCRSLIFFENSVCITCGSALGFARELGELVVLRREAGTLSYRTAAGATLRPCANLDLAQCNWLAEGTYPNGLCGSCQLTRTRAADGDEAGLRAFARTEVAKRRLVFQLDALGLPTTARSADPAHGLAFDLLSGKSGPVITGHESGVITIDLAEGDDPHREAMRVRLAEPYRTLLGHLRHEVGHWYWDVLVDRPAHHDRFRSVFGDERADYAQALEAHYGAAPSDDWVDRYVSQYATAHPWEDWAETFAHYLHIRDTLQTSAAWGVIVRGPDLDLSVAWDAPVAAVARDEADTFAQIIATWLPLTYALNAVNRSMGNDDLYPFVLAPPVLDKLRFVHLLVTAGG
jgi:hypothetical protein